MGQNLLRSVLIVSYYFPPHAVAASIRPAFLARILAEREWKVHVLHAAAEQSEPCDDQWARELSDCGIEIYPIEPSQRIRRLRTSNAAKMWYKLTSTFRLAPDLFDDWYATALRKVEQILNSTPINIILGIAPPLTAAQVAAEIARISQLPLAIDLGENIDLIPHFGAAYNGLHIEETLDQLLRQALYLSVPSRRLKEGLLRQYEYLGHEDVGIVPYQANQPSERVGRQSQVSTFLLVADDIPPRIIRPFLMLLRQLHDYRAIIAGVDPHGLSQLLQRWHLQDRVQIYRSIAPRQLDRWFTEAGIVIAFATESCTTASSIVTRARCEGKPILVVGTYADRLSAEHDAGPVVQMRRFSMKALLSTVQSLHNRKVFQEGIPDDNIFMHEFSRQLGIHMRL